MGNRMYLIKFHRIYCWTPFWGNKIKLLTQFPLIDISLPEICCKHNALAFQDSNQLHAVCQDTYPPITPPYMNDTSHGIVKLITEYNKEDVKVNDWTCYSLIGWLNFKRICYLLIGWLIFKRLNLLFLDWLADFYSRFTEAFYQLF